MSFYNYVEIARDELERLRNEARETSSLRKRLRNEYKLREKLNERLKELDRSTERKINRLKEKNKKLDRNLRVLNEELIKTKKNYTSLSERVESVKEELNREIDMLRRETDEKIKKVNAEVRELKDSIRIEKENKKELALQWLKNFENIISMIKELNHEKFKPGALNSLLEEARIARENINNGVYEAAIASMQERFIDARELFNEVFLLEEEFNSLKTIALNRLDEIREILEAQRFVEFEFFGEKETVDVNYWTNGEIEKILKRINELKAKIEDENTTTQEMVEIIKEENEIFETAKKLSEKARDNILLSEARLDIADNVIDTLENMGFDMVDDTFVADDKRKSVVLKFTNEAEEEIVTVISPKGNSNSLNIIFNVENTNIAMKDARLNNMLNRLKEKGIELQNFKCADGEVPHDTYKRFDDFEKIKEGRVKISDLNETESL